MRLALLAIFGLLIATAMADPCSQQKDCASCVDVSMCGWCSVPVTYQDKQPGSNCAGFGAGATPFVCNGIYSTDVCVPGYVCDPSTGACSLGAAGSGTTLAVCDANCK